MIAWATTDNIMLTSDAISRFLMHFMIYHMAISRDVQYH